MGNIGILTEEEYKNKFRVNNAVAFANPANYGLEQTITTLTQIVAGVQRQKFYTVQGSLTDYVPIEMGVGAYGKYLFQYAVAQVGDSFESGIVQPGNGINKDANLDITVDGISIRNNFWRMKYEATKEILEMARANAQNFSIIEEQEIARKRTVDLGIQKIEFLGTDDGLNFGLLNQPEVTIDTALLPVSIQNMTIEQLTNFAKTAISTYFANTNSTVFPNTWLMPTATYMSLGVPINPEFPIGTVREYLEKAFTAAGAPANFKILHTVYNNTAGTDGRGRHVLYNRDPQTLTMYIPKQYTPYPLYPTGSLDMISDSEMQFTGVWVKRPNEVLYLDEAA